MNNNLATDYQRALAARRADRNGDAIAMLEAILLLQPNFEHGTAHLTLGQCYEEQGAPAKARAAFENAVKLDPQNLNFVRNLAGHLYMYGEPEVAFNWFKRVLELEAEQNTPEDAKASTRAALGRLAAKIGISSKELDEILR